MHCLATTLPSEHIEEWPIGTLGEPYNSPKVPSSPAQEAPQPRPKASMKRCDSPLSRSPWSRPATVFSASSQDTGTNFGSSSRPFFGLVRFIGPLKRSGSYRM